MLPSTEKQNYRLKTIFLRKKYDVTRDTFFKLEDNAYEIMEGDTKQRHKMLKNNKEVHRQTDTVRYSI